MPKQKNRQIVVMAALLGVGLWGATSLHAEHPRDIGHPDYSTREGSHFRNTDLTGGFYEDGYKLDNWYYDFYDSPGATRSSARSADPAYSDQVDPVSLADAAHPWVNRSPTRNDQMVAFQQYYDEPWFYDQRDPIYGMPDTRGERMAADPAIRNDNFVNGTVTAIKQVRNRTSGDQNTVALIKTADGRQIITDLGPTKRTLDMALTKGDQIQVTGQWEDVGPNPYSVLMAQRIKSGVNRVNLYREVGPTLAESRQVEGRIQQFRDIRTNRTAELHRTAAVQTPDGRFAIVDLGQDTTDRVVANASPGDRIVANGRVVQVGNYPVLLANQVAINDGAPIHITRPTEPAESPSGSGIRNPDCVGGGCDNRSLNRAQPRDPHTNAMDGTVR
jgi:hypothetical protein